MVVGDPATELARRLDRLPGARIEALAVASTLGTWPLVDEQADEVSLRARLATGAPILHLATHGLLDEDAPNLSSLVLAGHDELTVAELLGLGLDTDLAVLSACDSGRGDVTFGGEVVGLARGLLAAGVRHSVVSLWPVDDMAGCVTMTTFTEHFAAGDSVATALAKTQRLMRASSASERLDRYRSLAEANELPSTAAGRRSGRNLRPPGSIGSFLGLPADHPSWWAPFVHIGDPVG